MRLEVPFYVNNRNDCGPVCMQMVLKYFGEEQDFEELKELTLPDKSGLTFSMGLARAAAKLGFPVEFFSVKLGFNPEAFDNDFYRNLGDGVDQAQQKLEQLYNECQLLGVKLEERSLAQEEIFAKLDQGCVAIGLFDWAHIKGRDGFHGHFMVIVGYDDNFVFLHQPGPKDPQAYFSLTRDLFDSSRKRPGTDEDLVIIHAKKEKTRDLVQQ